jgi:hypothetical protein
VAPHLARRTLVVLKRGTPYVLRDLDGRALSEQEPKTIVTERFRVPMRSDAGDGVGSGEGRLLSKSRQDMHTMAPLGAQRGSLPPRS